MSSVNLHTLTPSSTTAASDVQTELGPLDLARGRDSLTDISKRGQVHVDAYMRSVLHQLDLKERPSHPADDKYLEYHVLMLRSCYQKRVPVEFAACGFFHDSQSFARVAAKHFLEEVGPKPRPPYSRATCPVWQWLRRLNNFKLDRETRYETAKTLVQLGQDVVKVLYFDRFKLKSCRPSQILSLCHLIIDQGPKAADTIPDLCRTLPIRRIPYEQKLALFRRCADSAASSLTTERIAGNFKQSGLIRPFLSAENPLSYCRDAIQRDPWLGTAILNHLNLILKDPSSPWERLELCELVVARSGKLEKLNRSHGFFEILGFENVLSTFRCPQDIHQWFQRLIVLDNAWMVSLQLKGLSRVHPKVFPLNERLKLCQTLMDADCERELARNFSQMGILSETSSWEAILHTVAAGSWGAVGTAGMLDRLQISKRPIGRCMKLTERLAIADSTAAITLARHIRSLKLERASLKMRLALADTIAENCSPEHLADLNQLYEGMAIERCLTEQSTVEDRIKLCLKILPGREWLGIALLRRHWQLHLEKAPLSLRVALCQAIVDQGPRAATVLTERWPKALLYKIDDEALFRIIKSICESSPNSVTPFMWHIHNLELGQRSSTLRLRIIQMILSLGETEARTLVKDLDKLPLGDFRCRDLFTLASQIHRLDPCEMARLNVVLRASPPFMAIATCESPAKRLEKALNLIAKAPWTADFLRDNLRDMGFLKDISDHDDREARMDSCRQLTKHSWTHAGLSEHLDELDLISDIDSVDTGIRVAEMGPWAAMGLVRHINMILTEDPKQQEKVMSLVHKIIDQGPEASALLAKGEVFNLKLKRLPLEERLKLALRLAGQGEKAAKYVAIHLRNFRLDSLNAADALQLLLRIAQAGPKASKHLAEVFHKFDPILEIQPNELMQLLTEMAKRSHYAARKLATYIPYFSFERHCIKKALPLYHLVIEQDKKAAWNLASKLHHCSFRSCEFGFRLHLYRTACARTRMAPYSVIGKFHKINGSMEQRQILLELLIPPTKILDNEVSPLSKQAFAQGIRPLLTVFTMEEKDFLREGAITSLEQALLDSPIADIYAKVQTGKDPTLRLNLTRWCAYTAGVLYDLPDELQKAILNSRALHKIFYYPNPTARYVLTRQLSLLTKEAVQSLKADDRWWVTLADILFLRLRDLGFCPQQIKEIQSLTRGIRAFRSAGRLNDLIRLLSQSIQKAPYTPAEAQSLTAAIHAVLAQTVPKKTKKGTRIQKRRIDLVSYRLHLLASARSLLGENAFFQALGNNADLAKCFKKKFCAYFPVEDIDCFAERYQKSFGSFRDPMALFTYLGSLRELPKDEWTELKATLDRYVRSVLLGEFHSLRYNPTENPHLDLLVSNRPGLLTDWQKNETPKKLQPIDSTDITPMDFRLFLRQRILTDKHLGPLDKFPLLVGYLKGAKVAEKELASPNSKEARFETLSIQLCEGSLPAEAYVRDVRTLGLNLKEFNNDLSALIPRGVSGNYVISESDEPCDLLLSGTEVKGSCQRISGDPELNSCLLGYLMNGDVRLIVVKSQGKIVARSVLRLMWDPKAKGEVLLLERLYSNVASQVVKKPIMDWALNKAQRMGTPLLSKELGTGAAFMGPIEFRGGLSPIVYSDAGGSGMKGPFTVRGCHILYKPESQACSSSSR